MGSDAGQTSTHLRRDAAAERRRSARFALDDCQVRLTLKGLAGLLDNANLARRICDLSEGGAQVAVTRDLEPGTKVQLSVVLEKFQDGLVLVGLVRWKRFSGGDRPEARVGIEFKSPTDVDRRKIQSMQSWFTSAHYVARRREDMKKNPLKYL